MKRPLHSQATGAQTTGYGVLFLNQGVTPRLIKPFRDHFPAACLVCSHEYHLVMSA